MNLFIQRECKLSKTSYFVYIWEYIVKKEYLNDFKNNYGSSGSWVTFFKKSEYYVKTELLIDKQNSLKFMTIDYWKSKEKYLEFININKSEYDILDQDCNNYTSKEVRIGEFYLVKDE